jgi:hypothetical protein
MKRGLLPCCQGVQVWRLNEKTGSHPAARIYSFDPFPRLMVQPGGMELQDFSIHEKVFLLEK